MSKLDATQVTYDGRRGDGKKRRELASSGLHGGTASAFSSRQNLYKGNKDIMSLVGLKESKQTNYNNEEKIINDVSQEMRQLIENLELRNKNENKA